MKSKLVKKTFKRQESHLEEALLPRLVRLCLELGIPAPLRNQKHLPPTDLEFDFSWAAIRVAIEVNGGIDRPGRRTGHTSRAGLRRDYYKSNLAQLAGWLLLIFPPEYCTDEQQWRLAAKLLKKAILLRTKSGV